MSAVVIGGGLAGAAAALDLAARHVPTVLVRSGPGATALSWGCIEIAGASSDPDGLPWRDPVRGEPLSPAERLELLLRTRRSHPYAALFPERDGAGAREGVAAALAELDERLRPELGALAANLDASCLVATVRGAVRVVDAVQPELAGGDLQGAPGGVVIVDVPGLEGFDARSAARLLGAEIAALGLAPRPVRVERPALPESWLAGAESPARLAARLDEPEAAEALAKALAPLGSPDRALLLPPVLGLRTTPALVERLVAAAGGPVAELVGAPPWSPTGLRLARALDAALERAGVEVRRDRAVGVDRRAGRATAVELAGGERLPARSVVLATGRFTGGGLGEGPDGVGERVLGLPVFDDRGRRLDGTPARRALRRRYADPQPLFTAGVRVDGRLRPLDAEGRPRLVNLVAAGEVIGGFDPAVLRTGLGFALLSGRRAGAEAAHLAAEPAEETP